MGGVGSVGGLDLQFKSSRGNSIHESFLFFLTATNSLTQFDRFDRQLHTSYFLLLTPISHR
jgi:hypothetical protein